MMDMKTTLIGVGIIALIAYSLFQGADSNTVVSLVGLLAGSGFIFAKDSQK